MVKITSPQEEEIVWKYLAATKNLTFCVVPNTVNYECRSYVAAALAGNDGTMLD